ncbi:Hypothetical_protein [Hexamita inflata]|uniref:Hypothetical_protein n=1 Tax=Hexamita inflata TaxID=28002 RepID=A0AA86VDR8_9EUKA|nr:Hypothetical protein HINF_LOCUS51303 [Hexamita inflata]
MFFAGSDFQLTLVFFFSFSRWASALLVFQVIFLSSCFFQVSLNLRITVAAVSNQLYNSLYNLTIFSLRDQIFLSLPFALGITLVWVGLSGFFFVGVSSSLSLPFSAACVDFFLVFVLWAFSKYLYIVYYIYIYIQSVCAVSRK